MQFQPHTQPVIFQFYFTDEELLSHPWNSAMLEVMVQLTDDNPMSIATTLDMLQLVNMIAQDIY